MSDERMESVEAEAAAAELEQLGGVVRRGKSGKFRAADLRSCGAQLTDDRLPALATLTHLVKLELADTAITDQGLAHVSTLRSLTHLDLQNTRITNGGLAHLESLKKLKLLLLSGTQVTRDGLKPLRQKLLGSRIVFP